ncbi:MAG: flagellar hook-associated protein FlgL [Pseudomonadales bacterium]|nr:flagellar hook-associated protein FlgL [Pseudomonadales bacterium]
MRVSTHQVFQRSLNGILDAQTKVSNTQEQISTGKRVNKASDDPAATASIYLLKNQIATTEHYVRNSTLAEGELQLQESVFQSIESSILRVRELIITAGNGAYNAEDRKGLATEVSQRLDEMLNYLNSKSANGEYMFAGHQGQIKPFAKNPAGGYQFQGDEGQRLLQISSELSVAVRDSGKAIFADIPEPENFSTRAAIANTGTGAISVGNVINQEDFSRFHPQDIQIEFVTANTFTVKLTPSGTDVGVTSGAQSGYTIGSAVEYVAGQPLEFEGVHIELSGVPQAGDDFFVESDPIATRGLLNGVDTLLTGLNNIGDSPAEQLELEEMLADALVSLDAASESLSVAHGQLGARLNVIETAQRSNEDWKLLNQTTLSDLEDVDYTEVISRFSLETVALQAAQQSYARISSMNLFQYL